MKEVKNVPRLRFKGFEGEWEEKKLGEIVTEIKRKADNSSTAPVMMISATQGFINQSEKYSADNAGSSLKNYTLLKKGELSYNHGYSKTRNFGSCFTLECDEARVPFVYHSFSLNEDDSSFFGKYLNSGIFDKELKKRVASTARMDGLLNISFDEYTSLNVRRPSYSEQEKIGTFLSHVDSLIQAKTKKLESLKAVKKSLLQKCFPKAGQKVPEMRFAGFTGEWEEKKLGDVITVNSGKDYKQLKEGNIPVYGTGGYMLSVNAKLSDIDAIGIGRKGTIDHPLYLKAPFWTVDTLFFMTANNGFNLNFIFNLSQNIDWKSMDESTSIPSLSKNNIVDVDVFIPPTLAEQEKIGRFFSKYDSLISAQQKEINKLKDIKKSLLQKMFV